jgi:hypothetical protein
MKGLEDVLADVAHLQKANAISKNKRKRDRDPNQPKGPLSSYMLFSKEQRLNVMNEHPDYDPKQCVSEVAKRWRELDEESKEVIRLLIQEIQGIGVARKGKLRC